MCPALTPIAFGVASWPVPGTDRAPARMTTNAILAFMAANTVSATRAKGECSSLRSRSLRVCPQQLWLICGTNERVGLSPQIRSEVAIYLRHDETRGRRRL